MKNEKIKQVSEAIQYFENLAINGKNKRVRLQAQKDLLNCKREYNELIRQ